MKISEFIRDEYPIQDRINQLNANPIQQVRDSDMLPCDDVRMLDGELQKVVEITDGEYVGVLDLLSYCREDVDKMQDEEFKTVWYAYMDNIDTTDMTIDSIMSAARDYMSAKKKKEKLLEKCTS